MNKIILFLVVFLSFGLSIEKENIIDVLERYNKAFGEENYSEIISFFDYPTSFNLKDKTVTANNRFKLRLIYKKLRGDIPEYYSYSRWDKINIQLIDNDIAIVNADFSRYDNSNTIFYSGSVQYCLRLKNNEWKIFSLTPYESMKLLN